MIDLSKWEKATYWNTHDRCPNDYGPRQKYTSPYPPGDELETIKEWEELKETPVY